MHIFLTLIFFCSLLVAGPSRVQELEMPPRQQWFGNNGYCGETALISAGIYYGQYMSQYTARSLALKGGAQTSGELLLGQNAIRAARNMHLHTAEWAGGTSAEFLEWVRQHILEGHPVVIGVYANQNDFYGTTDPTAGDPTYDHIVTVFGVRSGPSRKGTGYYQDDMIVFSDHGLWSPDDKAPFIFRESFADFQASRVEANDPNALIYSLPSGVRNYGIAILGINDTSSDTLPIRLQVTPNSENPPIADGSNTPPPAGDVTIKITISGLKPDRNYVLYRYDNPAAVPEDHFNAKASQAVSALPFLIRQGTTCQFTETRRSNETAIYRAVARIAP